RSRPIRPTRTCSWSGSSLAGLCGPSIAALPGRIIDPARSATFTRSPGTRGLKDAPMRPEAGAAWSDGGGDTWQAADIGRDRHYTWAVALGGKRCGGRPARSSLLLWGRHDEASLDEREPHNDDGRVVVGHSPQPGSHPSLPGGRS